MIDELRATLDQHAEQVTARPDPYPRVLLRRRRRRQRRVSALVLVAVLLVAGPAAWLGGGPDGAPVLSPPPLETLRPLLDSPTRGSLAADAAFLAVLRQRAATEVNRERGDGTDGPRMPADPALIKVLFAGDIGSRRVAVLAGVNDWPLYANYQGGRGDDAAELVPTGSGQLEPVVDTNFASSRDESETYLLLGPAGAVYEKATTTYTAAGVTRSWAPVETHGDYLAFADLRGRQVFRVVLHGTVLLETAVGAPLPADGPQNGDIDARPAGGRGRAFPDAARQAANVLQNLTGLAPPDVTFRVLWSDEIEREGTTTGRAYVVTVQAVLPDGGGPFFTATFDTGDGSFRDHPSGYGVAGAVEDALIVMRLPHYVEKPGDRLQIVAPPAAVRAEVADDRLTQQVTLVNGVGHLDVPPGMKVTVKAYDAKGKVLAEKQYVDLNGFGCSRFDPWSCPSPPPTVAPAG